VHLFSVWTVDQLRRLLAALLLRYGNNPTY